MTSWLFDFLVFNFLSCEKQLEKTCCKDITAWTALILAAHRVQQVGRAQVMSPCSPRITVVVICSAVNAVVSSARMS